MLKRRRRGTSRRVATAPGVVKRCRRGIVAGVSEGRGRRDGSGDVARNWRRRWRRRARRAHAVVPDGVGQRLSTSDRTAILVGFGDLGCRVMGCFGVSLEGFPERLRLLRLALRARCVARGERAGSPRGRAEGVGEDLDKVGGKHADGPPISEKPAGPPRPVSGVETLDQVAFDESEIAFGLGATVVSHVNK